MTDKWILNGKLAVPCSDLMEWARWFETHDRVVEKTDVGPLHVSTVFLGIDHSFGHGEPLIFETMIFGDNEDEYQVRSSSWDEAERCHAEAVGIAEKRVAAADKMLGGE